MSLRMVKISKKEVAKVIKQVKATGSGKNDERRFQCWRTFAALKHKQVLGERVRWNDEAYTAVDIAFPRGK